MRALQKVFAVFILTSVVSFGILAQDQKNTPGKDRTPGVKVEKDKNGDKPPDNRNRGNDNKENKDKGDKKPPSER